MGSSLHTSARAGVAAGKRGLRLTVAGRAGGGGGGRWNATGRARGDWREHLQRMAAAPARLRAQGQEFDSASMQIMGDGILSGCRAACRAFYALRIYVS